MIQRFLVSFVVCLLVLSSQIAFAADIDWDSVPKINSKAQLATYIENGRRRGQTEFHFVFLGENISNKAEFDDFNFEIAQYIAPAPNVHLELVSYGTGRFICKITKDFSGNRVANAYRSGDTSNLTMDEANLYNIAVGIVNEANKRTSEIEKARYIHDEICKRVEKYQSHTNEDAIGALIIGVTNCKGYSDAFYTLGVMSGLNVRRIGGKFDGEGHVWNTITLSNGKSYCVDVTMDDGYNTDEWFLADFEVMKRHHVCEWEIIPNLQ